MEGTANDTVANPCFHCNCTLLTPGLFAICILSPETFSRPPSLTDSLRHAVGGDEKGNRGCWPRWRNQGPWTLIVGVTARTDPGGWSTVWPCRDLSAQVTMTKHHRLGTQTPFLSRSSGGWTSKHHSVLVTMPSLVHSSHLVPGSSRRGEGGPWCHPLL